MAKPLPVTGLQTDLRVAVRIVDAELPLMLPGAGSIQTQDRLKQRETAFGLILRELLGNDWEIDPDSPFLASPAGYR